MNEEVKIEEEKKEEVKEEEKKYEEKKYWEKKEEEEEERTFYTQRISENRTVDPREMLAEPPRERYSGGRGERDRMDPRMRLAERERSGYVSQGTLDSITRSMTSRLSSKNVKYNPATATVNVEKNKITHEEKRSGKQCIIGKEMTSVCNYLLHSYTLC